MRDPHPQVALCTGVCGIIPEQHLLGLSMISVPPSGWELHSNFWTTEYISMIMLTQRSLKH